MCSRLLGALADVGSFANAGAAPEQELSADSVTLQVWEEQGARAWAWLVDGVDASYTPPARDGVQAWPVRATTWAYGDMAESKRAWLGAGVSLCAPDVPACAQFRGDFLRARAPRLREGPLSVIANGLLTLDGTLEGAMCTPELHFTYADAPHARAASERIGDVVIALRKRTEQAGWGELRVRQDGAMVTVMLASAPSTAVQPPSF